jgi:hypothetical protein
MGTHPIQLNPLKNGNSQIANTRMTNPTAPTI